MVLGTVVPGTPSCAKIPSRCGKDCSIANWNQGNQISLAPCIVGHSTTVHVDVLILVGVVRNINHVCMTWSMVNCHAQELVVCTIPIPRCSFTVRITSSAMLLCSHIHPIFLLDA